MDELYVLQKMSMLFSRLSLFLIALMLVGCITPSALSTSLHMTESTVYFADSQGPSPLLFNSAMDDALSGDDRQLKYILSLSRFTDGEGALNYGGTLLELQKIIGVHRFNSAFDALSSNDRIAVELVMNVALEMRRSMRL